ncbi:MAG TPA: hypothetical protein VGG74_01055 [Kofleriaceae bacterium]|jgi:hypothetical protein
MIKLKHQLVVAMLFVLPISSGAYAQQAPTTDDSGPVTCPPPPGESNAACPSPDTSQTAQAEPEAQPAPPPPPAQYSVPPPHYTESEQYHIPWLAMTIGGGVDDFAGDTLRHSTQLGGSWNARLTIGQHNILAGEVSYIGSAQNVNGLGIGTRSTIVGNGVQGDLRLNGTINSMFQPFIYGGAAWRHYSTTETPNAFADLATTDDVFEIPVGAGIAAYFGGLTVDVRGEYRFAFGGNSNDSNGNSLDRWGATGNFGFEF